MWELRQDTAANWLRIPLFCPLVPVEPREAWELCLPSPTVRSGMGHGRSPPGRPWLISRKKKVWHQTSGVGSENMTREILRLQMGLKGENTMGLKAGGYLTAVIEPKCIVCLISLTALIGWFKPSKHLGKPGALPSGACWSHFFFLCKRQDDQGHQEGKFESKMCAFLRTPQWLSCRQDGGCWKPPWTSPLWLVTLRSP